VLLQGGAMLEHHFYTGADVSPRAAVNFTLAPGHVIRFGVSRAYRSPTFFEEEGNQVFVLQSGAVVDSETVPSEGLEPERVISREIGYVGNWRALRLDLDMRLYRDRITDFIGLIRAPDEATYKPKVFTFDNIGTVDSQGGEIQLRWRPTQSLDVSAHYARVFLRADTVRENYNVDIPQSAPRNSWGVLASYRLDRGWETSLGVWRTDAMKWLTEGDLTEAYTRVDLRLARRWKWQGYDLDAALVGQNLGNDYQEFRDTNVFSRRIYGSLSVAW
jgi:iron complex outermembrane receptor protein